MTSRDLVLPSPAQVHEQAGHCGIDLGEPRFLLIERAVDFALPLTFQTVTEGAADWLLYVARVLAPEPDDALFELLSRLAYLTLRYTYDATLTADTTQRLTSELFDAFAIWRTGDKYQARVAFVLALVHAAHDL